MAIEDHISPEETARLAEGGLSLESAEPILAHLSRCRSCMAAYVEAVRYRAAWLAEREEFEPPKDVLDRGRALLGVAPPRRRTWPLRLAKAASLGAAVWLVLMLAGRINAPPGGARVTLPPPVARALAEKTSLGALFIPGADAVRAGPTDVFRGAMPTTEAGAIVTDQLLDSLRGDYDRAQGKRQRERVGYCLASALLARGSVAEARERVVELLAAEPRNCACRSLAAELEFGKSPELAERHLRDAEEAGCRDDVTRMNLAIVRLAMGDTAGARSTFEQLEHRDDALGDRARQELQRAATAH